MYIFKRKDLIKYTTSAKNAVSKSFPLYVPNIMMSALCYSM